MNLYGFEDHQLKNAVDKGFIFKPPKDKKGKIKKGLFGTYYFPKLIIEQERKIRNALL